MPVRQVVYANILCGLLNLFDGFFQCLRELLCGHRTDTLTVSIPVTGIVLSVAGAVLRAVTILVGVTLPIRAVLLSLRVLGQTETAVAGLTVTGARRLLILLFSIFCQHFLEQRIQDAAKFIDTAKALLNIALALHIVNDFHARIENVGILFRHIIDHCDVVLCIHQNLLVHRGIGTAPGFQEFSESACHREHCIIGGAKFRSRKTLVHFLDFPLDESILNGVLKPTSDSSKGFAELFLAQNLCQFRAVRVLCVVGYYRPPVTVAESTQPHIDGLEICEQDMCGLMNAESLNRIMTQFTVREILYQRIVHADNHRIPIRTGGHILVRTHHDDHIIDAFFLLLLGYVVSERTKIGAGPANQVLNTLFRKIAVRLRGKE